MVRRLERRYRKAYDGRMMDERWREIITAHSDDRRRESSATDSRKAYAGKVKSLIEKKHRRYRAVVGRLKSSIAVRGVLSGYPRKHSKYSDTGSLSSGCDSYTSSEFLEDVYESQKLNFRRMISNISRGLFTSANQWDEDSWTDLESNFSLIYEPTYGTRDVNLKQYPFEDDDVTLTLEKVRNMKNVEVRNNNNNNNDSIGHPVWDRCFCDSCERLTPDYSDAESFLSSCSSCLRNVYSKSELRVGGKFYRNVAPKLSRCDSWTNSEYSETYEPVSAEHVIWTSKVKKLKKKLRSPSSIKTKLQFSDSWSDYKRFTPTPLAIDSKEKRMKELIEKLKEDLDSDWDSNASVNLGLIYIPMEEPKKAKNFTLNTPPAVTSVAPRPPATLVKEREAEHLVKADVEVVTNNIDDDDEETLSGGENEIDDPLGSLESLIFEPKDADDSFPKAIGRNSKLKASINVSNVAQSISGDSISTVVDGDVEKDAVVVGNYWEWSAEREVKIEENASGPCSDCKTCAGETSVVSWTYFGRHNPHLNTSHDSEIKVKTKTLPVEKGKEVTWKMIVESRKAAEALLETSTTEIDPKSPPLNDTQLIEIYNSWSDLESLIFPDEAPVSISEYTQKLPLGVMNIANRMTCYTDDWLWWDQQKKSRNTLYKTRSDTTWRTKAKRMFLWMHLSQESPGCLAMDRWTWWKAKQRASILWLISKANNNKVPDDLKEPYYKDHDDQDQLKPVIVHALATAELYCLALGNIYADPNYHNLNHWGVIQALARKGVYVAEPSDVTLTETVLIQTSPIRMSAHMAVIEAIMALYLKETITVERIVLAVKRFLPSGPIELPADIEDALVFWINKVCVRMKHRIEDEMGIANSEVQKTQGDTNVVADVSAANAGDSVDKSNNIADKVAPPLSLLQDLSDLSDGCCLAALISYYCPNVFRWQSICLNYPMGMADSLHNLQLVQKFGKEHLPYDPCFLTLEDLVYQHSSVTQNILVLLAELFFLFEIRPAKCVFNSSRQDTNQTQPEIRPAGLPNRNGHNESGLVSSATKRSFQQPVSPIPDLRNSVSNSYYTSIPDLNRISPKGTGPAIREPLLPRRHSQHERMQERSKRFSFNEGPKMVSPNVPTTTMSASIRRSHSVQDIDKNGVGEVAQNYNENEAESAYYSTSPVACKQMDEQVVYESTSELYLKPLPCGESEQLMPAVIKPHKEKNNRESKPEELGEFPVHRTGRASNQRDFNHVKDNGYHSISQRQPSPEKYINYNLRNLNHEVETPSYMEIKPESRYDYQDNRQLEESLMKQPYILSSNDGMAVKEGLESFGSSESGVVLDHLPKKEMSTTSFAQLSKLRENQKGINFIYMQHERDGVSGGGGGGGKYPTKSSFLQKGKGDVAGRSDKKTSFASLPNQTTWQQQQVNNSSQEQLNIVSQEPPLVSQLADVRLKLEEKRRNIEAEKRKAESMKDQAREQIGKTAFLQVVSKGKTAGREESESEEQLEESLIESRSSASEPEHHVDNKELNMGRQPYDGEKTYGEYNRSIEHLTSSLSDLQSDIQRLTLQQEKIQHLMKNGLPQQVAEPPNQFYLHDQSQLQPAMQPMWSNRSPSSQEYYAPPQQIPRSHSREQLYQPLQRTQSREQLMGAMVNPSMSHQMGHWGNEPMMTQPYSMGPMFTQQTYIEQQPGFNLHSQPHFIPMYGNTSMMPPNDAYGGNYGPYQPMSMMTIDPHRPPSSTQMHIDVSGMSAGGPTSSHSQSQMTFHRSIQQPPRPPSRPSSAPANAGPVAAGPSLTMKATPVMAPLDSYMEPQSVHFLDTSDSGDDNFRLNQEVEDVMVDSRGGSSSLENVVSGTATYRVREPLSPTRPVLGKTFRVAKNKLPSPPPRESRLSPVETVFYQPEEESVANDKGFFVPFNGDSLPRKPKPVINNAKKVPKVVQKTEPKTFDQLDSTAFSSPEKRMIKLSPPAAAARTMEKSVPQSAAKESYQIHVDKDIEEVEEQFRAVISDAEKSLSPAQHDSSVGFVISDDSKDEVDLTEEEMARRKERILLSVIRRKEQQEMLRARKELETAKRREKEQRKQETLERKKEDERMRRQVILEQYRQRKAAMEEQENDRESSRTATLPKPKLKPGIKPRPKSLHESALSGQEERQAERMTRASGTRGSQSNISSRATPPRRAPSPGQSTYDRHPPSPISYQYPPGGLPPGLVSNRRPGAGPSSTMFNDTASDSCSTASSTAVEYTGPKLFKQPTAKSNRGIIVNAINTVLAGAVNEDVKRHVLEEIQVSESKHFLILFRDAGCQFRALYSYSPEKEEVIKLYGTGPKQLSERMIDKFFKYNCGGRNFTVIQTKHLTVTIDAFTIHNSLWQGKKVVQGRRDL